MLGDYSDVWCCRSNHLPTPVSYEHLTDAVNTLVGRVTEICSTSFETSTGLRAQTQLQENQHRRSCLDVVREMATLLVTCIYQLARSLFSVC